MLLDTGLVRVWRWQCTADLNGQTDELRDRWHVISFTHAGSFMVHSRGQSQMIDATRAMVIHPGEGFRMTRCNDSSASGSALSVHPHVMNRLAPHTDNASLGSFIPVSAFLLQHLLLRRLVAEANGQDVEDAALWVAEKTFAGDMNASRVKRPKRGDAVSEVQFLLARRFRESIHLDEIARSANRSLYHLCRTFKRETGLPLHHYLTRLRLRASLETVVDAETNLSALAQSLGYSSHSHFSEAFRNEFRVSPTKVRQAAGLPCLSESRRILGLG